MSNEHHYRARLEWTGAAAGPTRSYQSYSREWTAHMQGKPPLVGSADPNFRGDPAVYNPEDLLLIALSSCHMLSYLYLASRARILVLAYADDPEGTMALEGGGGHFTDVLLRPRIKVAPGSDMATAERLHEEAHKLCFIAASVNFPVRHAAHIEVAAET